MYLISFKVKPIKMSELYITTMLLIYKIMRRQYKAVLKRNLQIDQ